MKQGDRVIVGYSQEAERLGIAGRIAFIVSTSNLLHSVDIQIEGYPKPFTLDQDEVETPTDAQMRAAGAQPLPGLDDG